MAEQQLKQDIQFLLSFVPASHVEDVEPNLSPMFYITGSYEKDVELISMIEDIKSRYDIANDGNFEDFVGNNG